MTWRTAHGEAAAHGRLVASETLPSDELAMPSGSPPNADRSDRDAHGHFAPGNRVATSKRIRAGLQGALTALEKKADAAWCSAARWGHKYGSHRRSELAAAHGGEISAGVGALVEDAALLRADARYWRARGMAEGNPDHCKLASSLLAQARGAERDAWELASREASARKSNGLSPAARLVHELTMAESQ